MKANQFLLTIICLLIIYSCKRESPCSSYTSKNFKFLLADSTKAQIPYNGNETLMFISNQGDTAILIGQGKINQVVTGGVNVSNDPACPKYDDYSYEYVNIEYKGNNENLFHVFYRVNSDKGNEENTNVVINDKFEYEAYSGYYNDTSRYNIPILIKNNKVNGLKLYGIDNKPIYYNKAYGILKIQLDSNLIYTLTQ